MQAQTLINYFKNPALLNKESVPELQKLIQDFPFFQGAHILLSMASKKWDATVYQQSLKKTAIVISNRVHLFNLINGLDEITISVETDTIDKKAEILIKEVSSEDITKLEIEALKTTIEDIKHELDILKATEVVAEKIANEDIKNVVKEIEKTEVTIENNITEVIESDNLKTENLEQEIEKSFVNAFVEKELIKTPELNHLELNKKQPESFTDWLQLLKKNNGQSSDEIKEQVAFEKQKHNTVLKTNKQLEEEQNLIEIKKLKQKSLIDKIIESNPGAIKNKEEKKFFVPITQAKESLIDNEHLITETLAKIYAMQGNVNKAVRAYEILSLKFPQKSVYFASLIKSLKENQ